MSATAAEMCTWKNARRKTKEGRRVLRLSNFPTLLLPLAHSASETFQGVANQLHFEQRPYTASCGAAIGSLLQRGRRDGNIDWLRTCICVPFLMLPSVLLLYCKEPTAVEEECSLFTSTRQAMNLLLCASMFRVGTSLLGPLEEKQSRFRKILRRKSVLRLGFARLFK